MNKIDELIQQYCPEGVEYVSIGSLITRVRDKGKNNPSVKTVYSVSNTLGLVKAEDFRDNVIYSEDTSYYVVVEQGMFAYNPARLNIGSLAYLQNNQPGLVSPMYVVFGIDKTKILPKYLYLYLKSPYIICKINSLTESGARFRFDFERWGLIEIPLPPLPVQEAIVNILDCFAVYTAELQAELQARQQQYNYYRDTLLSFEGREDVQWKKLGEVCDIRRGIRVVKKQLNDNGVYPVFQNSIPPMGYYDQCNREGNLPYVICAGSSSGSIGYCSSPFWAADDCYTVEGIKVINRYAFHTLKKNNHKLFSQVRNGSMPRLPHDAIDNLIIPIPSLEEQERISTILDRFDALINDLSQGLPAEIEARQQQYEYYRDQLLTFKRKEA